MSKNKKIEVMSTEIRVNSVRAEDYISLTDIAKRKNADDPRFVIQNWMRTRYTMDFLGIWEYLNNSDFNRVEFEAVKNESGSNAFVMTPTKWINLTNAVGIVSKAGRYRLACTVLDINRYLFHNPSIMGPMISRLRMAREGIKHDTANQYDILKSEDFSFLKTIVENVSSQEVKMALKAPKKDRAEFDFNYDIYADSKQELAYVAEKRK